ncbi:hypothetical protein C8R44DRAFT_738638 [Mycena epipterygia]|nr:hypothetical protein C8R44DRAFT_738638 [Mycena epipterygia]
MSSLSEISLSLLVSAPPTSTTTYATIGVLVLTVTIFIIHLASPMRLTRILVAAIVDVEKTYFEAVEAGVISKSDVHIVARLSSMQIQVSHMRETTLRNSLSYFGVVGDFFKGRSITVLKCIREVRALQAHIEILKEEHLRDPNHLVLETTTRMISLRQRHTRGLSL